MFKRLNLPPHEVQLNLPSYLKLKETKNDQKITAFRIQNPIIYDTPMTSAQSNLIENIIETPISIEKSNFQPSIQKAVNQAKESAAMPSGFKNNEVKNYS